MGSPDHAWDVVIQLSPHGDTEITYIFSTYVAVLSRYTPRPYNGPAILFKGEHCRYHTDGDWEQLLEEYTIYPVAVAHLDLLG